MTQAELFKLLKTVGIPIAYGVFNEEQIPPYMVYYRDGNENVKADDAVYYSSPEFALELYQAKRNLELEGRIEKLLCDNELPFEVDETYLPDEKLRMITYRFSI